MSLWGRPSRARRCEQTRQQALYDQGMEKQTTRQRVGIAALILSLAIVVTGCSPASVSQSSYDGFPLGIDGNNLEVPRAYGDSSTLYLVLGGSSSCPPLPTAWSEVDGVVEITVESDTEGPCTKDFMVTTHEINIGPVPDEVVLIVNNEARQTLTVEPL